MPYSVINLSKAAYYKIQQKERTRIMKHFRTFIITKNKIKKAAGAVLVLTAVTVLCAFIDFKPEAVPAFSSVNPADIIKEGTPHENDEFDYKEVINKLLGFDTSKPETIIESSSAVFEEVEKKPITTEAPTTIPVQSEKQADSELPSHEEIATASGLKINNATNYNINLDLLCADELEIELTKTEPEVLIVHTHTTECFIGDEMSGESERTTNHAYNMCAVGEVVSETLNGYGIQTIHDKTIHDYPSYQGAYTRALETINSNLEKYPSIKIVLDIHRDAYIYSDGSKLRVAAEINGQNSAQVMLVLGTDSMGLHHPYWQSNLKLAAKIQNAAEIMYPGIMRPLNLRRERFNMHATTGSLLLEIGSNGNTLSEAKLAAECIARAIAAVLLSC